MYKSNFKRKKKKPCHPFIDLGLKQHAINATNKTIPTKCLPHRLLYAYYKTISNACVSNIL